MICSVFFEYLHNEAACGFIPLPNAALSGRHQIREKAMTSSEQNGQTPKDDKDNEASPAPAQEKGCDVLLLWADPRRGIKSIARTIAGTLEAAPHNLRLTQVDLPEAMAARSLVQQVASMIGTRLEAAVVSSMGWPPVEEALAGRKPRVVVAMDPVAAAAVDAWRAKGHLRAPLVGVVSSLWLDPAWASTAVDRLSVVDETQAEAALDQGLPAECLVPCGVPVCGGFSSIQPDDKEPLRKAFDLPVGRPVVLVVTDGLDSDQLTGALLQLGMVAENATLMFDVARDDEAADLLRRRAGLYGIKARMFGKVEEAGQLWAAADAVVARPLAYVEQRVIPNRLPLICLHPRGEAEQQAARCYRDQGVGAVVEHPATLAAEVEMLLQPDTLQQARQRMQQMSKVKAADDVARLVAQVRVNAEQILAETRTVAERPAPGKRGEEAEAKQPAKKKGPLEIIGEPAEDEGEEAGPAVGTLADLEAAEAEAGRQVLVHQEEAERWNSRMVLAREKGDDELVTMAKRMCGKHQQSMHHALAELARLAEQRKGLQEKATRDRKLEQTFRKMEVDDALAELKKKMGL